MKPIINKHTSSFSHMCILKEREREEKKERKKFCLLQNMLAKKRGKN
jgi:hypothetical protein